MKGIEGLFVSLTSAVIYIYLYIIHFDFMLKDLCENLDVCKPSEKWYFFLTIILAKWCGS